MQRARSASEQYRKARDAFFDRRLPECLELLESAELLGQKPDDCDACRWDCWMLLGRFEEAWKVSDRILARGARDPLRLWDGRPFAGNRVVIRCLHGFGDALQFLRYARMVRQEAASVTAQTHPQLVSLLRGMPFLDRVVTWSDEDAAQPRYWDQQIEVMELPFLYRTTLDSIPVEVPYLFVPPEYAEARRNCLPAREQPRVGLLWQGGGWNPGRDIPFAELRPILESPGVELISFQRGAARDSLAASPFRSRIRDLSGDSPETAYFAADLPQIDLLITVDTMAAHLAGALGRPVWVILPFQADWRWMTGRSDSPWYPTMRLFRQRLPGDWRVPVAEVAAELQKLTAGFMPEPAPFAHL